MTEPLVIRLEAVDGSSTHLSFDCYPELMRRLVKGTPPPPVTTAHFRATLRRLRDLEPTWLRYDINSSVDEPFQVSIPDGNT